jgi:hypothetical protein
MALDTLSSFAAALSEEFGLRVFKQMNRKAVLLSKIAKVAGGGPNCAWDVKFSGAAAGAFTEGAAVNSTTDLAQDINVPATLAWGLYRSNFGMSGLARAVAAASRQSPRDLLDRVADDLDGSASKLGSVINAALYTGSGAGNIIGLQTALATTGSYAGIAKATYAEWAGNVETNGSARALTKPLMDAIERKCYVASGEQPNLWICSPGVAQKYEGLFDANTRNVVIINDLANQSKPSGGGLVKTETGATGLFYKGHEIFRDKDCPTGHLFALNTDHLQVVFVPAVLDNSTGSVSTSESLADERGMPVGLMAHFQRLAKEGDSDRYSLVIYPQLKLTKVNAHGMIDQIDET